MDVSKQNTIFKWLILILTIALTYLYAEYKHTKLDLIAKDYDNKTIILGSINKGLLTGLTNQVITTDQVLQLQLIFDEAVTDLP